MPPESARESAFPTLILFQVNQNLIKIDLKIVSEYLHSIRILGTLTPLHLLQVVWSTESGVRAGGRVYSAGMSGSTIEEACSALR